MRCYQMSLLMTGWITSPLSAMHGGYLGSCVPFIASLILVLFAEPIGLSTAAATAIAFLLNAVWWLVVTLPLLKNYKQIYYIDCTLPNQEQLSALRKYLQRIARE